MNRKPQPADSWWSSHQSTCNGTFEKVSEAPEIKKEPETANKFKGKGRTWSDLDKNENSKVAGFFKKKTPLESFKCVNCTKFETKSLEELNEHLDVCLINSSPKKFTINLVDEDT